MAARLREAIGEKRSHLKETLLDRDAKIRAIETWKRAHDPQADVNKDITSPTAAADSDALTSALNIDKKQLELVKEMQVCVFIACITHQFRPPKPRRILDLKKSGNTEKL